MTEKEFNLSENIVILKGNTIYHNEGYVIVTKIKEFIKRRDKLVNAFVQGEITSGEMRQKLNELAGEKLC